MSTSKHQEVTSFVGGKSGGGANVGTGLSNIKKGDILILNADTGEVLTGGGNTITTAPNIAFASCVKDGIPIISGVINGKALKAGSRQAYVAPVPQVSAFGYSSVNTAATIPAAGSEYQTFSGAIVYDSELRIRPNRQERHEFSAYSKGGYDLAKNLVLDINRDVDTNPRIAGDKLFTAVVTANGSQANIGTAATATVIKGSTKVTFSSAHGLSIGDIIYFPNGGVYTVYAVPSTTVITLDYAYIGASEVYLADTVKELTTVTLYGVQVTAKLLERENPVDQYSQIKFTIGLSENFNLKEDVVTAYVRGVGSGWQVRDKEVSCLGWMGYTDRNDTKRNEYSFSTEVDKNYVTVSLSSEVGIQLDLQQNGVAPVTAFLAFDNAASTQLDAVMAILTPWAATGGIDLS
ncbi:hypothetical protein [Tenacibaculum sp.]|uniref:hypothetical protein n=1 Tax=Tenacibaculum sp. TaxID=1906242 RepID=UPI003D1360FA